ncbi:glycosyltransferase [Sulfolobus sp. A20]|uniref:glycosyltransferase family 39 protein n=1 Tax=Sulfolobaceae TaxID=118883 RepID=UPI000845C159|nr:MULTISPECIES: glycosyltransferase family 39 protein [unclassified Sulfolobus]TRM76349.1 glycosyltransferase [Sulfolobus sp. E5]TRM76571.1 glycosyltransferase [Sulfolobus sp. B5]TRM85102.1 glycosyltransferase [Sulfolobus sp. F3]TRM89746.1 glycosyltransferase [Sulfolobus sp. C3]TRN01212.1 glycosyltransferase [Sulfolobus sp. F1]TRN03472.1 glycosyltransferase [Sulfolobus sp. E1]
MQFNNKWIDYFFYIALISLLIVYTYETVITFAPINGYIGDEVWYPTAAYNLLKYVFHVTPPPMSTIGYPNEQNIQTYLNPEHPPLAKYIMAVFIYLLGYNPVAWRLPSWILGDLTILVAFFLSKKIVGNGYLGNIAGLLSALLIALDPNFWVLHGIGLLDIYVSFFGILSLYFLLRGNILLSSITLALAMLSKEPAYVLIFPFLFYLGELTNSIKRRAIYGLGLPIFIYVLFSIPLIAYYGGVTSWLDATVIHRAIWDVTNGHITLTATSQISTPWDWFLDIHPFYLGYNLYASTNPYVLILWIITTPIAFIFKDIKLIVTTMWAWTEWIGFVIVYFLGNHTLFSFYVTDFMPVVDVYVVMSLFKLVQKINILK